MGVGALRLPRVLPALLPGVLLALVSAAPVQAQPSLQQLLGLPPWLKLQLAFSAEPLANPLGGNSTTASWIQQSSLNLAVGTALDDQQSPRRELDHWQARLNLNHFAGDWRYNEAVGALFPLQTVAHPTGFWLSEASLNRKGRNDRWSLKAGILPINPSFVAVPVLDLYVHSSLNNTLNLSVPNLPISPYAVPGGVVAVKPRPDLSLRYGWFHLEGNRLPGPGGAAQFLQVDLEGTGLGPSSTQPLATCRRGRGFERARRDCPTPGHVANQLPGGLISLGGYNTSSSGNGLYGSVTLRSGLPLGLDERVWVGASITGGSSQDPAPGYLSGGLVVQGLLPGRPLDLLVLGAGRGQLDQALTPRPDSSQEAMLELGYRLQLHDQISLQPTVQWIFSPSGSPQATADILAAGVQLNLNF